MAVERCSQRKLIWKSNILSKIHGRSNKDKTTVKYLYFTVIFKNVAGEN